MTYYRDPLLDTICDRIALLDRPAYVKNSELVFVAANQAFAQLFNLSPQRLTGTNSVEHAELDTLIDVGDKERACVVFGEDQRAHYADPFGHGRFLASMERFVLADGQTFIYCVFEQQPAGSFRRPGDRMAENPSVSPGGMPSVATLGAQKAHIPEGSPADVKSSQDGIRDADQRHDGDIYRALLDRLPVPIFLRGSDHRLVFVNKAFCELVGADASKLIGTTEFDLYGARAKEVFDMNEIMIEVGEDVRREFEMPLADGRTMPSILKTSRLIDQNGNSHVVGTITDITEIRRREMELRHAGVVAQSARADFENIVSNVDVGLIVLDRDLNVLLANESYVRRIWTRARAKEESPVGMDYRSFLRRFYDGGIRPLGLNSFENYHDDRVAEIKSGRVQAREVVYEDGSVVFYSGVQLSDGRFMLSFFDLTEVRKQHVEVAKAREAVERSYQLVLSATDTMPEGLMVLQGDEILLANRILAELMNVPESILAPGSRWEEVYRATSRQNPAFDETSIEESLERFKHAIRTRKDIAYNFPLGGDRWIHLELRTKENGQAVILCTDQTAVMRREVELKRLISKAEAADRAKSEFLANMSHEIRTPMNGILGMAELLGKAPLDSRHKTFVDVIMKSGTALMTIINDILDFSRLDAGQMQIRPAPFNPFEAIEDVAALLASRAAEKDIEILTRRSGHVPVSIVGDAGRFRQIVTNLVGNAIKFTESGHIMATLSASQDRDGCRTIAVSIADTGIGIPADKLDTIFEQFSQVDGSSTRRHEGTGLGLAISQRLARLHGGEILVQSTEGRGSTFTLRLPANADAEFLGAPSLPAGLKGARILIIDSNPVTSSFLLEQVTDWGFEGVTAMDAHAGLAILDGARSSGIPVDAVLLDSPLSDLDLAEAVRRIREGQKPALGHSGTAVIVLSSVETGDISTSLGVDMVQAGLMKPVRAEMLRDTIIGVVRDMRLSPHRKAPVRLAPAPPAPAPRLIQLANGLQPHTSLFERPTTSGHILVAEDNEVNRIVFSQILQASGYAFRIVENGLEAVESWLQSQPILIIMDVSMPVMDGLQATRRIREIEAGSGAHMPIIGVTAHALAGDRELCLSSGMDDYMTKPISPERLEEKIQLWIADHNRAARQG